MKATFPILLALVWAATQSLPAQETPAPPPVPDPQAAEGTADTGESTSSSAWLRVWVMMPAEVYPPIVGDQPSFKDKLSLITEGDDGKPQYILSEAVPFGTSGYVDFPAKGKDIRLIKQMGNAQTELARTKVDLKVGMFATVVIQKISGNYSLSIIDDTLKPPEPPSPGEPAPPPPKQIFLYNFLPTYTGEASCKDPSFSKPLIYGSPQMVSNLPAKLFYIQIPRTTGKRLSKDNIEIDMRPEDSLSLLVVQDLYGRTVAKVIPNGKLD